MFLFKNMGNVVFGEVCTPQNEKLKPFETDEKYSGEGEETN